MSATDEKAAVDEVPRQNATEKDAEAALPAKGPEKYLAGLEDPDAGLSDEERAKMVCLLTIDEYCWVIDSVLFSRIESCCGSLISGLCPGSACSTLPPFSTGPTSAMQSSTV